MGNHMKIVKCLIAGVIAAVLPVFGASAQTLHGIDVYHGDGDINWTAVKTSGHGDFAYIKALDGEHTRDGMFTANRKGAAAAGVAWGPYQFFHPYSIQSAKTQAENYWAIIRGTGYTLIPAVDVEVYDSPMDSATFRTRLDVFLTRFQQLSGVRPVIYTMRSMIAENAMNRHYAGYVLWQADPDRSMPVCTGWPIGVWQYSWSGRVSGLTAPGVDLDIAYSTVFKMPAAGPAVKTTAKPAFPSAKCFGWGKTDGYILTLDRALIQAGYGRYYKMGTRGASGSWGWGTQRACAAFQRTQGWRGGGADGVPGPETWRCLQKWM